METSRIDGVPSRINTQVRPRHRQDGETSAEPSEKLLQKKLEEGLTEKPQRDAEWDFAFPDPGRAAHARPHDPGRQFGTPTVNLYITTWTWVSTYNHASLVGPNGAGKTTFVKLMTENSNRRPGAVRRKAIYGWPSSRSTSRTCWIWSRTRWSGSTPCIPKVFTKLEMARTWLGRYGCTQDSRRCP